MGLQRAAPAATRDSSHVLGELSGQAERVRAGLRLLPLWAVVKAAPRRRGKGTEWGSACGPALGLAASSPALREGAGPEPRNLPSSFCPSPYFRFLFVPLLPLPRGSL